MKDLSKLQKGRNATRVQKQTERQIQKNVQKRKVEKEKKKRKANFLYKKVESNISKKFAKPQPPPKNKVKVYNSIYVSSNAQFNAIEKIAKSKNPRKIAFNLL